MKRATATITSKGQITLPIEVRRTLGLVPSDKVLFIIKDDGTIQVRPVEYTIDQLRGILPPLPENASPDLDELIDEAMAADSDTFTRGLR